jgi:hypothetical protein
MLSFTFNVIENLADAGYIRAALTKAAGSFRIAYVNGIAPRGRVATGQRPGADIAGDLLQTLETEIERTTDEEKRSRLRRVASACTDLGKDLLIDTLAKVIVHSARG